jgi:hypothetical protein
MPSVRVLWAVAVLAFAACSSDRVIAESRVEGLVLLPAPVSLATVKVYQLNEMGTKVGDPLGTGATDVMGAFKVPIGPGADTLLVEVSGEGGKAYYYEAAAGERVSIDPQVVLTATVTGVQPGTPRTGVPVTPLTTIASHLASARFALKKHAAFPDAVQTSYLLIGRHFLAGDHFGDAPLDKLMPADPTVAKGSMVTAELRYGFALAGLSKLASIIAAKSNPVLNANTVNTVLFTGRLADDVGSHEALFDGVGSAGNLSLGSCTKPDDPCTLTSNTVRSDLGQAMIAFVNSTRNITGLSFNDVEPLVASVSQDANAELFPSSSSGSFDRDPPTIVWDAPAASVTVVRLGLKISVHATDTIDREPTLVVDMPSGTHDEDTGPSSVVATIDTKAMHDGPLSVQLTATDHTGNYARNVRMFTVDNTAPTVTVTGVMDNGVYPDTVRPVVTVADANPDTLVLTLDGQPYSSGTDVGAQGSHRLTYTAKDKAGNQTGPTDVNFTIGKDVPVITLSSPAEGKAYKGPFNVTASADSPLLASFTMTWAAGVGPFNDADPTLSGFSAQVSPTMDGIGVEIGTLIATTTAGLKGSRVVRATIDTHKPVVTVDPPATNTTTQLTYTVTGTVTDLTDVRVTVNGVPAVLSGGGSNVPWHFSATIPLINTTPCGDGWTGMTVFLVTATDLAENQALDQSRSIVRDNCPPTVQVLSTLVYNELGYAVSPSDTTSYAPCLAHGNAMQTELLYTVQASSEPTTHPVVVKYGINTGTSGLTCSSSLPGLDTDGNPIVWLLQVQDQGGHVASVRYQIRPAGGAFGPEMDAQPTTPDPMNKTFKIVVTRANAPGLDVASGDWEIKLIVKDDAGNVAGMGEPGSGAPPLWNIKFTTQLIDGPVFAKLLPDRPSDDPYIDATSASMATLYAAGAGSIDVGRLRLYNGTSRPAKVQITASMGLTGTLMQDQGSQEAGWFPDGYKCTIQCLQNGPSKVADQSISVGSFITQVGARSGGNWAACTDGTQGPGCATSAWTVPAGSPGSLDVYLLANGFGWLKAYVGSMSMVTLDGGLMVLGGTIGDWWDGSTEYDPPVMANHWVHVVQYLVGCSVQQSDLTAAGVTLHRFVGNTADSSSNVFTKLSYSFGCH